MTGKTPGEKVRPMTKTPPPPGKEKEHTQLERLDLPVRSYASRSVLVRFLLSPFSGQAATVFHRQPFCSSPLSL